MSHRSLLGSAALLLALATGASPSLADDRATAQQLFQQGKELMTAGKFAEACTKFAGAAELSQTPGVRLNLADCYEKVGRTASAWTRYDEALTLAERTGDAQAAELARTRQAALRPTLSYLSVVVSADAARVAGLEVDRDGQRVPGAAWGTQVPVDPGEHEVKATAPGRKPWSSKTTVGGAGTHSEVAIPVLAVDGAQPIPPTIPPSVPGQDTGPTATASSGLGTQRVLALVSLGLGVVGIGVGSGFGVAMLSDKSDYQKHQGTNGQCLDAQCASSSQSAVSAGNVATVGFLVGGALIATGAVLWFTAPKGSVSRVGVVPVAGPRVAGLGLGGSW